MATTAVRYAEQDLRVHTEYEQVQKIVDELCELRERHVQMTNGLRGLRFTQEETENEIAAAVRAEHDLPSAAAYERKFKETLAGSDFYQELRKEILARTHDADAVAVEVKNLETRVKLGIARTEQIGSLLKYYAASKEAQTEARRQAKNPVENWPG